MKRKTVLLASIACLLTAAAAVLLPVVLPGDLSVSELKAEIRRKNPQLFGKIKRAIITQDQDAASIGVNRNLPLFRLVLSRKDVAHFSDLHEKLENPDYGVAYYAERNAWRNAVLEYDGEVYDIKIKSHGRTPTGHRNGKHISFGIKLERGKQINHCRRFNLLVRDHFKAEKQLVYDVARSFGVLVNQEMLVRLGVNNWDEKLYFFDRRFSDAFMEATRRPSLRSFGYNRSPTESSDKSSIYTGGDFDPEAFRQRFMQTLQELEYPVSQHEPLCQKYLDFNLAMVEGRVDDVVRCLDLDYISSFEAARLICGMVGHFAFRGNLYVFYDTANGKFYPGFTRDCNMSPLSMTAGATLEQQINANDQLAMFRAISRSDGIRQDVYRKVYDFITREQATIAERHRRIREYYEKLSYYGWSLVALRRMGAYNEDFVSHNLAVLDSYLDQSDTELTISTAPNQLTLEVLPRSMAAIRIGELTLSSVESAAVEIAVNVRLVTTGADDEMRVNDFKERVRCENGRIRLTEVVGGLEFSTALDGESRRVPRTYVLSLTFQREEPLIFGDDIKVEMVNTVTGRRFEPVRGTRQEETETPRISPTSPNRATKDEFALWQSRYSHLDATRTVDGELLLRRGDYTLEDDLLIPEDLKLVIEAGTTLRLGENRALVAYRGVDVQGTPEAPVTITSIEPDRPFGTVGILGDRQTQSTIRHLHLSNGSERWVDGVYFSGALSLHYNGTVHIADSTIALNHADDGLNVKYGDIRVERCLFVDNAADYFDADICTGTVADCRFVNEPTEDANGDGLDVSGSQIVIRGCAFTGFADKGVSVGEESNVLCLQSAFQSNVVAVAVKDLSHVFLIDNAFLDNVMDVDAFQKKTIFGGGRVYLGLTPSQIPAFRVYCDDVSEVQIWPDAAWQQGLDLQALEAEGRAAFPTLERMPWVMMQPTVNTEPEWRPAP